MKKKTERIDELTDFLNELVCESGDSSKSNSEWFSTENCIKIVETPVLSRENGWMFTVFCWIFSFFPQVIPTFSVYFQYCQWNKSAVKVLSADWLFCNCNRRFTLESGVSVEYWVDSMISVRKRHLLSTWNWPCSLQINEMSLRRFLILLKLTFSFSRVDESCP